LQSYESIYIYISNISFFRCNRVLVTITVTSMDIFIYIVLVIFRHLVNFYMRYISLIWNIFSYFYKQALGIVCVGIVGHYFNYYNGYRSTAELFFLLITTTFMIGTFILLLSCLTSLSTASIISKTIHVSIKIKKKHIWKIAIIYLYDLSYIYN